MALELEDKFIGFVDILGFSQMVEAMHAGNGRSPEEIREMIERLRQTKECDSIRSRGHHICPQSKPISRGVNLETTQVSDCLIISTEASPIGALALIDICWMAALSLLQIGVMVRGHITRGPIYHKGTEIWGAAYQDAVKKEKVVAAFQREADERGTPFIELDQQVRTYVESQGDECVRKMFGRLVKTEGDVTAIFPFQRLSHSFFITSMDAEKERRSNDSVRKLVNRLKDAVLANVDGSNDSALQKSRQYIAALDGQLAICDKVDSHIDLFSSKAWRGG